MLLSRYPYRSYRFSCFSGNLLKANLQPCESILDSLLNRSIVLSARRQKDGRLRNDLLGSMVIENRPDALSS